MNATSMASLKPILLLGLIVAVSSLPPPSPRVPGAGDRPDTPRYVATGVQGPLDYLGLSSRLNAAVAPLLDAFLVPFVDSLPDDFLEELAATITNETLVDLRPDPLAEEARYFDDEDKLQFHEDVKNTVINREE